MELKRIRIRNVTEILSDAEMKLFVGGYDLPEVVVYGQGTPCGDGIIYGNCFGIETYRGDKCDYIREGRHWFGTCKGAGDPYNAVLVFDAFLIPSDSPNGITCHGTSWVACS